MKIVMTAILMLASIASFANDTLTGSALLKGKKTLISAETNVLTAKSVLLNKTAYKIDRINESEISASNITGSVDIYLGEAVKAGLAQMTKAQIVQYFNISNGAELKCVKGKSQGFIVVSSSNEIIGNCIN